MTVSRNSRIKKLVQRVHRVTNATPKQILMELRRFLPNPETNPTAYENMEREILFAIELKVEPYVERTGKKVSVTALRNELETFFDPPSLDSKGILKKNGHKSTLGWENRKGGH